MDFMQATFLFCITLLIATPFPSSLRVPHLSRQGPGKVQAMSASGRAREASNTTMNHERLRKTGENKTLQK
jgi:hypothetical protein